MKKRTVVTIIFYVLLTILLGCILIIHVASTINGIERQVLDVLHKYTAWISLKAFEYNATDKAFESDLFEFSNTRENYIYSELSPIAQKCFNTTMSVCENDSIRYIHKDRAVGRIYSYSDSSSFANENPIFTYFAYLIMAYNPIPVDEDTELPDIPVLESEESFKTTMTQYIIEDALAGRYVYTNFLNEKTELCYKNAVSSYRHFRKEFLEELSYKTIVTDLSIKSNIELLFDYYFDKSDLEICEVKYLTIGKQENIYSDCIVKYELMPVKSNSPWYHSEITIVSKNIVDRN